MDADSRPLENEEGEGAAYQESYLDALKRGSGRLADAVVETALDHAVSANALYMNVFQPSGYAIGRLWQRNEFSVAQEHLATAIIERQMGEMHTYFKPVRQRPRTLLLGCVENEFHRLGVRMVADFFEQDGWNVVYLGAAVPAETMISMAREVQPDMIGLSSQMVYHLPAILEFMRRLEKSGLGGVPVIAGGLPFVREPDLYQKMGVYASGVNAQQALQIANAHFAGEKK